MDSHVFWLIGWEVSGLIKCGGGAWRKKNLPTTDKMKPSPRSKALLISEKRHQGIINHSPIIHGTHTLFDPF